MYRPVFYSKHDILDNGFCPERERKALETSSVDWAQLSGLHMKKETEFNLRKVFKNAVY
jgi:hypothetical protein